jgi:hypothetical protein
VKGERKESERRGKGEQKKVGKESGRGVKGERRETEKRAKGEGTESEKR